MRLRQIWAESTFAVLKCEHKLKRITEERPSESNGRMPLICNGIKSKKADKSGINMPLHQPFSYSTKKYATFNVKK